MKGKIYYYSLLTASESFKQDKEINETDYDQKK